MSEGARPDGQLYVAVGKALVRGRLAWCRLQPRSRCPSSPAASMAYRACKVGSSWARPKRWLPAPRRIGPATARPALRPSPAGENR
jgi:hypothetical protein